MKRIKVWLTQDEASLITDDFTDHIGAGSDISKDFQKVADKIEKALGKGEYLPCRNCGKIFFVPDYIVIMAEPKLCSKKCAKEWLGN